MKPLVLIFLAVALQASAQETDAPPPIKEPMEMVVDELVECISKKDVTKSANCLTDKTVTLLVENVDDKARPIIDNVVNFLTSKLKEAKDFATFADQMLEVLKDSLGESVVDLFEKSKELCAEKLKEILHKIVYGFLRSIGVMQGL